ncbi:MAG: prepilin peptidase [Bryobacterales bacterium]|nr:prepilin peptidase [Bryobacterales bacterium]
MFSYPPPILGVLLILVTFVAGAYDIRYRRIPNWLSLGGVLLGIAVHAFLFEWPGVVYSGKGLALALAIYFPLFALRGMGAGDVKLMAAVGALAGAWNWIGIFVITGVLGGLFAIVLATSQGALRATVRNVAYIFAELAHLRMPYTGRSELDIRNPKALRLPHAAVIALGSGLFLLAAAKWAPN